MRGARLSGALTLNLALALAVAQALALTSGAGEAVGWGLAARALTPATLTAIARAAVRAR